MAPAAPAFLCAGRSLLYARGMSAAPQFMLVDPAHFNVSYVINPWMDPAAWADDPARHAGEARHAFSALCAALRGAGAGLEIFPGVPGLPDMVFPANAAVVLNRRAVVARFAKAERQGEEAHNLAIFRELVQRGVLDEAVMLPEGCFQEGAGDAIWDGRRGFFWTGFGQRSTLRGAGEVGAFFARDVVALKLATDRFYHLDTCFCPLSGGEVLFYPPAFTAASLACIQAHVAPELRLEASAADAAAFCVKAVNIGRDIVMAQPPAPLRAMLEGRGYRVTGVGLEPFILSGGGAYCMTLRLDRSA